MFKTCVTSESAESGGNRSYGTKPFVDCGTAAVARVRIRLVELCTVQCNCATRHGAAHTFARRIYFSVHATQTCARRNCSQCNGSGSLRAPARVSMPGTPRPAFLPVHTRPAAVGLTWPPPLPSGLRCASCGFIGRRCGCHTAGAHGRRHLCLTRATERRIADH